MWWGHAEDVRLPGNQSFVPAGRATAAHTMGMSPKTGRQESPVVPMSTPLPHSVTDFALSPVLVSIERNLSRLRDSGDLQYALALELNDDDALYESAGDRARRVQAAATRNVDLHGWVIAPTADLQGLAVSHGGYTVSIMLGRNLANYVDQGFAPRPPRRETPETDRGPVS
jgi:hypothetical protein